MCSGAVVGVSVMARSSHTRKALLPSVNGTIQIPTDILSPHSRPMVMEIRSVSGIRPVKKRFRGPYFPMDQGFWRHEVVAIQKAKTRQI